MPKMRMPYKRGATRMSAVERKEELLGGNLRHPANISQ